MGTYDLELVMNSTIFVMLENNHSLHKLDFLTMLTTRYIAPIKIRNNIPTIYHCVVHGLNTFTVPLASAVLTFCKARLAINAFNFIFLKIICTITLIITIVINAAVRISMSAV